VNDCSLKGRTKRIQNTVKARIIASAITLISASVLQVANNNPANAQTAGTCSATIDAGSNSWDGGYNQKLRIAITSNNYAGAVNLTITLPAGHTITSGVDLCQDQRLREHHRRPPWLEHLSWWLHRYRQRNQPTCIHLLEQNH
jgi:hypothetical protein